MKALSIKQPWAWLICHGHKDVENRSWRTKHRGPFLVHAGKTFDAAGYDFVRHQFPAIKMPAPSEFEKGGVVGVAEVVTCHEPGSQDTGDCTSPWYFGLYGFRLANASPLRFQPLKGMLNFFPVPPAFTGGPADDEA
jgi:hypothetical protein